MAYNVLASAYMCPDRLASIVDAVHQAALQAADRLTDRSVLGLYRTLRLAARIEHKRAFEPLYQRYSLFVDRPCLLLAFGVEYGHYTLYKPLEPYMSFLEHKVFVFEPYLFVGSHQNSRAFEPALINAYVQWYINPSISPHTLAYDIMQACQRSSAHSSCWPKPHAQTKDLDRDRTSMG